MDVQSIKRWQWTLIGLAGGVLLAMVRLSLPTGQFARNLGVPEFERCLGQRDDAGRLRLVKLVVQPAHDGIQTVTGERLELDGSYVPFLLISHLPYTDVAGKSYNSLTSRLAEAAAQDRSSYYRYAWWLTPLGMFSVSIEVMTLLVGGVWPTLLELLIGAGYGPHAKDIGYDLNRFHPETSQKPSSYETPVSAQANDQSTMVAVISPTLQVCSDGPPALNKIVETVHAGPAAVEEPEKEFGGEFYPTVVHSPPHPSE